MRLLITAFAAGGVIATTFVGAQAQADSSPPFACSLAVGLQQTLTGMVIRYYTKEEAANALARTQALLGGAINPAYIHQRRVYLFVEGLHGARLAGAVLPDHLKVKLGDMVTFDTARRDEASCTYVPAFITRVTSR